MKRLAYLALLGALSVLSACATMDWRPAKDGAASMEQASAEIPEAQLLDVWIEVFDPGALPADEKNAAGLTMDIREAEGRYMAVHLRGTMERSGYWGAVRVVPRGTEGAEVLVRGTILASDGEVTALEIVAVDASGRQWFRNRYQTSVPPERYSGSGAANGEAFQSIYNAIANDLAQYRNALRADELTQVRRVAELRFAADLAPDAFAGHVAKDAEGRFRALRLPAQSDPMYQRIRAIRERDFMLVDTINGHFDNFYREMAGPYTQWRKARAEESAAARKIERGATTRKVLGLAAIAGAVALEFLTDGEARSSTSTLRNVMVVGGAYAAKTGFDMDSEAVIHRDAIEELGESFSAEARPLSVEVEGQTHELTGSAEAQYAKWRALLRRVYASETGLLDLAN